MTVTATDALQAILDHHRALEEELAARLAALVQAVEAGRPHETEAGSLVAYLATDVLTHAEAEEHTLYAAAAQGDLAATVSEMIAEHRELSAAIERLARATGGQEAIALATDIGTLFAGHVAKENEVLLPALASREDVDLAALLGQMHRSMDAAGQPASAAESADDDPLGTVLSLLLDAATELGRTGYADRACRLTASAWAAVHRDRPDLGARATSALHRFARLGALTLTPTEQGDGAVATAAAPDLDVRPLAPAQRHQAIFAAYHALTPGECFVLVNDHDPRPLRYQFEAEYPDEHTWDYLEAGPAVWRVRIGRAGAAG